MRTEYRFFNNNSGFVSNIFYFDEDWQQPNNFGSLARRPVLIDAEVVPSARQQLIGVQEADGA